MTLHRWHEACSFFVLAAVMDSTGNRDVAQDLQRKILTYMVAHPEAKDTVDGIMNWWLAGIAGKSPTELAAVLDDLVRRGWVITTSYGPTVIYGLDKTHRQEVEKFLVS